MYWLIGGFLAAPALSAIAVWLSNLIFDIITTGANDEVYIMDRFLVSHKSTGPRRPDGKIGPGWHYVWKAGIILFAHRGSKINHRGNENSVYTIYVLSGKDKLIKQFQTDKTKVTTVFQEQLSPWHSVMHSYNDAREINPSKRQSEICADIISTYKHTTNALYYVYGSPGVGKTTLTEIVGRELKHLHPDMDVVKTAIDITVPGKSIIEYFIRRNPYKILIMELNEYDIALKTALHGDRQSEKYSSHAANKASLNNIIDFMQQQQNLVIIATTNDDKINDLQEYESFLRRFNVVNFFSLMIRLADHSFEGRSVFLS